jgi:chemotaxis protein MotA
MIVIVGCVVVLVAVLVGFTMAGGHIGALIHPSEFVTIGGAALGALIVMSPKKVLKDLVRGVLQAIKGSPYNKVAYAELLRLMVAITKMVRRDGMLALDSHISDPHNSPLFKKYPKIEGNHHARDFVCTALTAIQDDKATAEEIASAMEQEIDVVQREHHAATAALAKTADALPGFGIVAAVLGIVVTMQAIGGPAEEIGHKVGAALVGTFLGILLSYGFFAPLVGRMELLGEEEVAFLRSITAGAISIKEGVGPSEVVARIRRGVGTDCRPNRNESTEICKEEAVA